MKPLRLSLFFFFFFYVHNSCSYSHLFLRYIFPTCVCVLITYSPHTHHILTTHSPHTHHTLYTHYYSTKTHLLSPKFHLTHHKTLNKLSLPDSHTSLPPPPPPPLLLSFFRYLPFISPQTLLPNFLSTLSLSPLPFPSLSPHFPSHLSPQTFP